ncbi:hypothetical protein [Candidatus Nitrosotalea okcheonensis]|uniref:Uncharacterized protein n=1 Tax=Candidatus Nitrosotalea okcheonensis TaxID=1903276 RepID=A0A2H1FID3_9ARCH|nr:hypothetical protein [Candidatus Nitrosotalea okcheonensis]SMH72452.1 conserved exported protein of unknown function [Candidatus Nitrosotalea okcheonensis]
MIKPKPILIVSGILVLLGIAITAYQSQITSENLSNQQNTIGIGTQMIVTKEMNPDNNQKGVYSIQITDFKNDDNVKATIIDPTGTPIITKSITKSPIQETFKISTSGNYTLQIENHGQGDIQVLGIIGYYPHDIELADISGFIALIIGLSGLAVGMMYLIRNRARS